MNLYELAKKHQNDNSGYELVDWFEAALPAYQLILRACILEREKLSPVDQYVLRSLQEGSSTCKAVGGILGLETPTVIRSVERLDRHGCVIVAPLSSGSGSVETISMTLKGHRVLAELVLQVPQEDNFTVYLDASTGEYFLTTLRLKRAWDLRNADEYKIPVRLSTPTLAELNIPEIKASWRNNQKEHRGDSPVSDLLDVLDLENSILCYRMMRVLQYIRPEDGDVILQVYDQSDRMLAYENALLQMEKEGLHTLRSEIKPANLPVSIPDPIEKIVSAEVYAAVKQKAILQAKVEKQNETISSMHASGETISPLMQARLTQLEESNSELLAQIEELRAATPLVEVLPMVEHRPHLLTAIRDAKQRVIIVSPWLTQQAVNRELRDLISMALKRGVKVSIGYGFGEINDEERGTLRYLTDMQKDQGGENLRLHRIGDSHAKVVISDDGLMITTSFNWLSFEGRADRGSRVEFGTLVRDHKTIQDMIVQLQPLFNNQLPSVSPSGQADSSKIIFPEKARPIQLVPVHLKQEQFHSSSKYTTQLLLNLTQSVELECVYIPAGEFWMGSQTDDLEADSRERPRTRLSLQGYWIGRFPVTVAQYEVFVVDAKYKTPESLHKQVQNHPVKGVTWDDAIEFCKWLTNKLREGMSITIGKSVSPMPLKLVARLPTEAEWEKASRGNDGRKYPWGDQLTSNLLNFEESGEKKTTPVGTFSPQGDSFFGCSDMSGNVWEWTNSLSRSYPYASDDGRENIIPREQRILRGGSYHNRRKLIRCAARVFTQPSKNDDDFGFRLLVSNLTADQTLPRKKEHK